MSERNNTKKRDEMIKLLTRAYWMEIETAVNYIPNSINPDGVRAEEIKKALLADVTVEIGHAQLLGRRIRELYGQVPGSMSFKPDQNYLQPPKDATDIVSVIKGVIEAEGNAIEHYTKIIEACEGFDYVTADIVTEILRDEESHLREFEGFLREYDKR
jgi:bacterioferritin